MQGGIFMRAALIQMPVTADKEANLSRACKDLREAKARGGGYRGTAGDVLLSL